MSKPCFTKGPWVVRHYPSDYYQGWVETQYVPIHVGQQITIARDCQIDDAYLIAAAPELYAALEELALRCDGDEGVRADGSNIQTMRAHALLAKARGEKP